MKRLIASLIAVFLLYPLPSYAEETVINNVDWNAIELGEASQPDIIAYTSPDAQELRGLVFNEIGKEVDRVELVQNNKVICVATEVDWYKSSMKLSVPKMIRTGRFQNPQGNNKVEAKFYRSEKLVHSKNNLAVFVVSTPFAVSDTIETYYNIDNETHAPTLLEPENTFYFRALTLPEVNPQILEKKPLQYPQDWLYYQNKKPVVILKNGHKVAFPFEAYDIGSRSSQSFRKIGSTIYISDIKNGLFIINKDEQYVKIMDVDTMRTAQFSTNGKWVYGISKDQIIKYSTDTNTTQMLAQHSDIQKLLYNHSTDQFAVMTSTEIYYYSSTGELVKKTKHPMDKNLLNRNLHSAYLLNDLSIIISTYKDRSYELSKISTNGTLEKVAENIQKCKYDILSNTLIALQYDKINLWTAYAIDSKGIVPLGKFDVTIRIEGDYTYFEGQEMCAPKSEDIIENYKLSFYEWEGHTGTPFIYDPTKKVRILSPDQSKLIKEGEQWIYSPKQGIKIPVDDVPLQMNKYCYVYHDTNALKVITADGITHTITENVNFITSVALSRDQILFCINGLLYLWTPDDQLELLETNASTCAGFTENNVSIQSE